MIPETRHELVASGELSGAICMLGYWSPFFDGEHRRRWHDKASNAIAITVR